MTLTPEGIEYELEAIDDRIANTADGVATQELYEIRDEFVSRYGLEAG